MTRRTLSIAWLALCNGGCSKVEHAIHKEPLRPVHVMPTATPTAIVTNEPRLGCNIFRTRKEALKAFIQHGGDEYYVFVPASDPLTACFSWPKDDEGRLYIGPDNKLWCLPVPKGGVLP